jgi:hypothetical protein
MKKIIRRTLLWFKNDDFSVDEVLSNYYYGLSVFLNEELCKYYLGRNLQLINIYYVPIKGFELPNISYRPNYMHYYGGYIRYMGIIDYHDFNLKSNEEKKLYLWQTACDCLKRIGIKFNNQELAIAAEKAYFSGIEKGLCTDYVPVSNEFEYNGISLKARLLITFGENKMFSTFELISEKKVVFSKLLDQSVLGIEFFLEMYKKIEIKDKYLILKGHREIEYLPMKWDLDAILLQSTI